MWFDLTDEQQQRLRGTRLVAFDVDGVLTDGRLYFGPEGEALKCFHVHDGLGLKLLMRAGIHVAIITSRQHPALAARFNALGIEELHQGIHDKLPVFEQLLARYDIPAEHSAYVGDDLPDLAPLRLAGCGITVANAHPQLKRAADWVVPVAGGQGAVRHLCDALLYVNDCWPYDDTPVKDASSAC